MRADIQRILGRERNVDRRARRRALGERGNPGLAAADRIYLGNSVRGLIRAELIEPARKETAAREPAHAAAGS